MRFLFCPSLKYQAPVTEPKRRLVKDAVSPALKYSGYCEKQSVKSFPIIKLFSGSAPSSKYYWFTSPLPWDGGMTPTAIQVHANNPIKFG